MKKILFIEDDKLLLRVYQSKLEKIGYKVTILENGELALEQIKNDPPDLIVLDIIMPKKDGYMVLEELSSDEVLRKIPKITLTNLGQDSDVAKAKKLGATEYLKKSELSFDQVVSQIKSILK